MSNLKLKLKKIDPVKYALITACVLALVSFVMILLMFLLSSLMGLGASGTSAFGMIAGTGIIAVIVGPIIYFIVGFIFGLIGTYVLNFVLSKTGGLDLDFESTGLGIESIGNE